jgi:hypothetical protein
MKFIGEQHLLIDTMDGLLLLKIDYKSWKANVVSKADLEIRYTVVNQLDKSNFLVYDTDGFITGNLIGDEVIVSPRREFNFQYLRWSKLVGNRLYAFRILEPQNNTGLSFLQFCNIELVTLTEKTIEVPFPPSDNQATPIVCVSFQS